MKDIMVLRTMFGERDALYTNETREGKKINWWFSWNLGLNLEFIILGYLARNFCLLHQRREGAWGCHPGWEVHHGLHVVVCGRYPQPDWGLCQQDGLSQGHSNSWAQLTEIMFRYFLEQKGGDIFLLDLFLLLKSN